MTTVHQPLAERRLPLTVPVAIVLAWGVAFAVHAGGAGDAVGHHALVGEEARPSLGAFAAYGGAWVAMVTAMMLPSAIPLLRLFAGAAAGQPRPASVLAAFVAGYLGVWTLFGWVALGLDAGLHQGVEAWPWLHDRPWLVGAGVLALAGGFQLSSLKDACLRTCRHPGAYLLSHYRRGPGAAVRLGWGHGLFCLGCCWALMLVAFAAGVTDLRWMAAFTALMAYEKIGRHGEAVARHAGVALLVLAALVALHPFG